MMRLRESALAIRSQSSDRRPMVPARSRSGEDSEEGRALLQVRVALLWKVIFFISLLSNGLGAVGAIVKPGPEVFVGVAQAAQSAGVWWLCTRGRRSTRFLQWIDGGNLFVNIGASAFLGRHVVLQFAGEHGLATSDGVMMTDAYITILHVAGIGLMLAIRAALIPSAPGRTLLVTAALGTPLIASTFFVNSASGGLVWRALDSAAYPWLPATTALMWGFVLITCSVITWVIYGLRAEVREARRLGQYVLEQKIGEGGMGEVYRARHGMMRRPSALKLMRSDSASANSLLRFEREVQLTSRLTHPNTITIFDYGRTHDGVFYYAMELLDGATLQRIADVDGPQPAGRVVRILTMACGALSEAHALGLIHRDIKPANMMLCMQGGEHDVVKLLDFGLVKELQVDGGLDVTAAGALTGTPLYMAPESIREAGAADARTDIYALGAVAYFLLAGGVVFDGKSIVAVCSQHLSERPQPFATRGVRVPADLEAVIFACLEKDPAHRPQDAGELRQRLAACAVEPWDAENARTWWSKHGAALRRDSFGETGAPQTIAVSRSP
jgi:eukaryotic-like serine/threonine-protein kinase